jgi:hypothetical protein
VDDAGSDPDGHRDCNLGQRSSLPTVESVPVIAELAENALLYGRVEGESGNIWTAPNSVDIWHQPRL